ncbi:hypothetical protein SELMODRAFT_447644 [Selaginella moellendorffii]|uniref:CCHC-type domain-containing protein n=1 Tax=Selaginella moellendorffii TaxID=88036 RepID=D8T170_SELML|nr:hypothetical protein SELMODRAFT_447644 [Selaginella moellendorffii]
MDLVPEPEEGEIGVEDVAVRHETAAATVDSIESEIASLDAAKDGACDDIIDLASEEDMDCSDDPVLPQANSRKRKSISRRDDGASVQESVSRKSQKKLQEVLLHWSEWHAAQSFEDDEVREGGTETYFPALSVGKTKMNFWEDKPSKRACVLEERQTEVPLYDRGCSAVLQPLEFLSDQGHLEIPDEASRCFNCGSYSHALRDCQRQRDMSAINSARKLFMSRKGGSNTPSRRYYESTPNGKFDDIKPGSLLSETRRSLGIGEKDPPPWLQRMREIGYPPGYMATETDEDEPSGLIMFGEDNPLSFTEDGEIIEAKPPSSTSQKMTVEFPGINAPIPEDADKRLWSRSPREAVALHRSLSDSGRRSCTINYHVDILVTGNQCSSAGWGLAFLLLLDDCPPWYTRRWSAEWGAHTGRILSQELSYWQNIQEHGKSVTVKESLRRSRWSRERAEVKVVISARVWKDCGISSGDLSASHTGNGGSYRTSFSTLGGGLLPPPFPSCKAKRSKVFVVVVLEREKRKERKWCLAVRIIHPHIIIAPPPPAPPQAISLYTPRFYFFQFRACQALRFFLSRQERFRAAASSWFYLVCASVHHNFYLEDSRAGATNSRCNKQTINAGDNPCRFQSPLPYMLAGLAAMVLLVVISLMILACSYLRGYFSDSNGGSGGSSGSSSAPGSDPENPKAASLQALHNGFAASPEKIVVILAGQDKPTHLAQPIQVTNKLDLDRSSSASEGDEDGDQQKGDRDEKNAKRKKKKNASSSSSSSLEDDSSSNDVDSQQMQANHTVHTANTSSFFFGIVKDCNQDML